MNIDMRIEGTQAACDALDALRRGICEGAAKGLSKGMDAALGEAKSLCPVQTGALRESLRVEHTPSEQGATARLVSDAPYAKSVELGLHGAAKPFLYPAYKGNQSKIVRDVKQGVTENMNQ